MRALSQHRVSLTSRGQDSLSELRTLLLTPLRLLKLQILLDICLGVVVAVFRSFVVSINLCLALSVLFSFLFFFLNSHSLCLEKTPHGCSPVCLRLTQQSETPQSPLSCGFPISLFLLLTPLRFNMQVQQEKKQLYVLSWESAAVEKKVVVRPLVC